MEAWGRGEGVRLGAQPIESITERLREFGLHGRKPVRVQMFLHALEGAQEIEHDGFLPCNGGAVVVRGSCEGREGGHEHEGEW